MVLTQPAVACKPDNKNWAGTADEGPHPAYKPDNRTADEGIPTVQCRC